MSRFARICVISTVILALLAVTVIGAAVWLGIGLTNGTTSPPEESSSQEVTSTSPNPQTSTVTSTIPETLEGMAKILGPHDADGIPDLTPQPGEHPMFRVLTWAKHELPRVESIRDYSAIFTKQEQIDGKVSDPVRLSLKYRQNPVSIYVHYEEPSKDAGVEAIYKETSETPAGKGKMWGHGVGLERWAGTLELDPTGMIAMRGQRYPITEIGILRMLRLFIEIGSKDLGYGECTVTYTPEVMWRDRRCAQLEIIHPTKRDYFRFHRAIIRIDRELLLPVAYESYDWALDASGQPLLLESYSYEKVQLNNGFTDDDFSTKNESYDFP